MDWALRAIALVGLLLGLAAGCKLVDEQPKGQSPLLPLASMPDTITLEAFSAPAPLDDPQLAALWKEVEESSFPPDLRERLAQNGIKAGIVGPHLPAALVEMLKITDERLSSEARSTAPLDAESGITLRVMQPSPGRRHDLVVPHAREKMPLLQRVGGQVEGKTYYKPECRLALRTYPEADGRVRLELEPELQHGEFKSRIAGSDGLMTMRQERQRKLFPELNLQATLGPGQMLLLTCDAQRPGSVGHFFFTQEGEKPIQTLWIFRIAHAGPDRAFYDGPQRDLTELASDLQQ